MAAKFTGIASVSDLFRFAKYRAGKAGIEVHFFDPATGSSPYSTHKSIHIPLVTDMTQDAEDNLRFYVAHECDHILRGPAIFDIVRDKLGGGKHPLSVISNILEDWRIEYVSAHEFRGDRHIIDIGRTNLLASETGHLRAAIAKHGNPPPFDVDTCNYGAISVATKIVMAEYLPTFSCHLPDTVEMLPSNMVEPLNLLTSNSFRSRLLALRNEYDTWELSEWVYGLLWDKTPDEVKQEEEDARERGNPSPETEDGECEDGEDSETTAKDGTAGDADSDSDGEDDVTDKKVVIPWQVFTASDHENDGNPSPHTIDFGGVDSAASWVPYPPDQIEIVTRLTGNMGEFRPDATSTSAVLKNRVRQWLQAKAAVSYDGGHKSGSLRAGQLWRGGVPAVGNAEWNQRVFKRPASDASLDSAVLLLVDFSGSMSGSKIKRAASATTKLVDVLQSIHVPVAVLGFTDTSKLVMFHIKEFGERSTTDGLLCKFSAADRYGMSGNSDADAVLYAHHYLTSNINANRKVLVVLSDGCPTDAYSPPGATKHRGASAAYSGLLRVSTEIQGAYASGKSNIDICAIGIEDDNVKEFYKKHVIISNKNELDETLLGLVKREVI